MPGCTMRAAVSLNKDKPIAAMPYRKSRGLTIRPVLHGKHSTRQAKLQTMAMGQASASREWHMRSPVVHPLQKSLSLPPPAAVRERALFDPRCVEADKCLLYGGSKSRRQHALSRRTQSRDSQWLKVGPSDRERFVSGSTSRLLAPPKRWRGDQVTTFRRSSRTIWQERPGYLGPGCSRPFRLHCCWLRFLVPA